MQELINWGKGKGCNFVKEACTGATVFSEFCNDS